MNARIFIAIPVHNRNRLAAECVAQFARTIKDEDFLAIYDDASTESFEPVAARVGASYKRLPKAIGIEEQRRLHFYDFALTSEQQFTHLYLTDSDTIHDPDWRRRLLDLQARHGNLLTCGYNTDAHRRIPGNTIREDDEMLLTKVAPGASYLLARHHAHIVALAVRYLGSHWNWDWTTPGLLGNECIVSKQSVVDHIGEGGLHHPDGAGLDGGDVALNPTPYLQAKRREIIERLKA